MLPQPIMMTRPSKGVVMMVAVGGGVLVMLGTSCWRARQPLLLQIRFGCDFTTADENVSIRAH